MSAGLNVRRRPISETFGCHPGCGPGDDLRRWNEKAEVSRSHHLEWAAIFFKRKETSA